MVIKPLDTLNGLARVNASDGAVVLVQQVIDSTGRNIRELLGVRNLLAGNDERDECLALDATDTNVIGVTVDQLHRDRLESDHCEALLIDVQHPALE